MFKRSAYFWSLLVVFGGMALPVLARDFRSWRTDGNYQTGAAPSLGQNATNVGYNGWDTTTDATRTDYSLWWKDALRTDPPAVPPANYIRGTREQDRNLQWDTWVTSLGRPGLPHPKFTPNLPKGWNPVVLDLNEGGIGFADHFLIAATFTETAESSAADGVPAPDADPRDQVLEALWPQTANGLGVDPNTGQGTLNTGGDPANDGRLVPKWRLRVRDLAPLNGTNQLGVLTQAPILSRMPIPTGITQIETSATSFINVLYLVVGDGENDPVHVICLRIPPPTRDPTTGVLSPPAAPNPATFAAGGDVLWSYDVVTNGSPDPVAGISFTDIAEPNAAAPIPLLFITTRSGRLIALNAKAFDNQTVAQDGDPKAGEERWSFATRGLNGAPAAGFWYGMAPAAGRVSLTDAYPKINNLDVATEARTKHAVSDWMVFVADMWGIFRAFDAPGRLDSATAPTRWRWRIRWEDGFFNAGVPAPRPSRVAGEPERFISPAILHTDATPIRTSSGSIVSGSSDSGVDDEVVFSSERGSVYAFDALGRLVDTAGANLGNSLFDAESYVVRNAADPNGTGSDPRWHWPDDDTAFVPADPAVEEARRWPRELGPTSSTPGNPIDTADAAVAPTYYSRAPLALSLGPDANPDNANPNLDPGDDTLFVPYMQSQAANGRPWSTRGNVGLYEYVGSMVPYGFVQANNAIGELKSATATFGAVTVTIPLERMRVGTVKANGVPRANPNATGQVAEDTVYITDQSWYDAATNQMVRLPFGATITLVYTQPGQTTNTTDANLAFPSAFVDPDAANPNGIRKRASLSVAYNRLEQREPDPNNNAVTVDEDPAEVMPADFQTNPLWYDPATGTVGAGQEGWRQPAMFAAGGGGGAGTLMVPSLFRGRIIAFTNGMALVRTILGNYMAQLQAGPLTPGTFTVFNRGTGEPGEFYDTGGGVLFLEDMPDLTDVGASVSIVDGWMYVTYENGHTRAYANGTGSGAPGTEGPNAPIWQLPPPNNTGTLVRAPESIRILDAWDPANPTPAGSRTYRDVTRTADGALLIDAGETLWMELDWGATHPLAPPNATPDPDNDPSVNFVVTNNDLQAQVRSSNGAVQQLPGANRGYRAALDADGHLRAVIPVFTGIPSPTNPLTPGTPILDERTSAQFQGELTYDIQITQPGTQWVWPQTTPNRDRATRTHFWEIERNNGTTRFPTTAGAGNWQWVDNAATADKIDNEWAPLVSYNNPIQLLYAPGGGSQSFAPIPVQGGGTSHVIGAEDFYTTPNSPGRKNGDWYQNTLLGGHSGSGAPTVATIGLVDVGGTLQQVLFADHGKSSPVSTTAMPDAGVLRVADRSYLNAPGVNRPLTVRVQRTPVTKLGVAAQLGGAPANAEGTAGAPAGSFEQNVNAWDDGPDHFYPSISEARINVTKRGTQQDLATGPVQVPGRVPNGNRLVPLTEAQAGQMEQLAVQVDVPLYQPDDLYATRWRSPSVGAPRNRGNDPASFVNPFADAYFDRAEQTARTQPPGGPPVLEDAPHPSRAGHADDPAWDDRFRRVVIFNDANNNGVLDLLPTYREAYRTFAVQVMVKPDLKMEVKQQVADLGDEWNGKKGPGLGAGPAEIREFQAMQALLGNPPNSVPRSTGLFYQKYWRPFTLVNTGNVNLGYVKPELLYQVPGDPVKLIGLRGEGNDPWRALSLVNATSAAAFGDPVQIFLRTSFDDQMLTTAGGAYGGLGGGPPGRRGAWLQKAAVGAGEPGTTLYTEGNGTGNPQGQGPLRDPTNGGLAREPWITLNIPTGAALGNYTGTIRFYNDRSVSVVETGTGIGFQYVIPEGAAGVWSGSLERSAGNPALPKGEPLEPVTDPPLQIKVKVIENMVLGRGADANAAVNSPDRDRRLTPAATADVDNNGNIQRILLSFTGNQAGLAANQPQQFDLFGTQLPFDPTRGLFPFDELPLDRPPWSQLTAGGFGASPITAVQPGGMVARPSLDQDPTGIGVLGWTERRSIGSGNDEYRLFYSTLTPGLTGPFQIPTPDVKGARTGIRILSPRNYGGTDWLGVYALKSGVRSNLMFTSTPDPSQPTSWRPEHVLPTSRALSAVTDPAAFTTGAYGPLVNGQPKFPTMAWLGYAGTYGGSTHLFGRTDVYLTRTSIQSMVQPPAAGAADPLARDQLFGLQSFSRVETTLNGVQIGGEALQGNPARTTYVAQGIDWLVDRQPGGPNKVQVYLARPDMAAGQVGSATRPLPLIEPNAVATIAATGELVFPMDPAIRALSPELGNGRVIVNLAAGSVQFTMDTRRLARLALAAQAYSSQAPDPVILADYTPLTMRVTRGDMSASSPVVVPVISSGTPVFDASWYRQQIDGTKWQDGLPVAGEADRLWVFWKRGAGAGPGGPSLFYKVLRPGVRVRAHAIGGIGPGQFAVAGPGGTIIPEEVNPETGQVYFPISLEGQQVTVQYRLPGDPNTVLTETDYVTWQDESGERPVPMELAVNEGTLDAFVTYDSPVMTSLGGAGAAARHMERMWLFWSSTRGSGGDVFLATLAPRLGPEANVDGSIQFSLSGAALKGVGSRTAQQRAVDAAAQERRKPLTVPPLARRGPYLPVNRPSAVNR